MSGTYLATIRRHRWSAQMTIKKDNKLVLSASTVAFISLRGRLPLQLMKATILAESSNLLSFFIAICALQRCLRIVAEESFSSGRCRSISFLLTYFLSSVFFVFLLSGQFYMVINFNIFMCTMSQASSVNI